MQAGHIGHAVPRLSLSKGVSGVVWLKHAYAYQSSTQYHTVTTESP